MAPFVMTPIFLVLHILTALLRASPVCSKGREQAVSHLLDLGADTTIGEQDGYTPMHGAGFQGRAEVDNLVPSLLLSWVLSHALVDQISVAGILGPD